MARILLILSIALAILRCEGGTRKMQAFVHQGGSATQHQITSVRQKKIESLLSDLFRGASDMYLVYVSESLVNRIRTSDSALEFVFDKPRQFTSTIKGKYTITRILLPLTGDYAGSATDPSAAVFVANDKGFITGPLRNPIGRPLLLQLQGLLLRNTR